MAEMQQNLAQYNLDSVSPDWLRQAKRYGFSDGWLARLWQTNADAVRQKRLSSNIAPVYHRVDTCAAEFEAHTPYLYSTYETSCEANPPTAKR